MTSERHYFMFAELQDALKVATECTDLKKSYNREETHYVYCIILNINHTFCYFFFNFSVFVCVTGLKADFDKTVSKLNDTLINQGERTVNKS